MLLLFLFLLLFLLFLVLLVPPPPPPLSSVALQYTILWRARDQESGMWQTSPLLYNWTQSE